MTMFDDRERAFEAGFVHDQETQFKIAARRNRLIGEWAAARMALSPAEAEAYGKDVIHSAFEEGGDEAVMRKLTGDLVNAGQDVSDAELREVAAAKGKEALAFYMGRPS